LKKEAKTFFRLVCATGARLGSNGKGFLVLSFKKERLA
jgi:hypothetical protein